MRTSMDEAISDMKTERANAEKFKKAAHPGTSLYKYYEGVIAGLDYGIKAATFRQEQGERQ